VRVMISGQLISLPRQCICCGGTADHEMTATAKRKTGKRVVRTQTRSFQFPYCTACAKHAEKWGQAMLWLGLGAIGAIIIYFLISNSLVGISAGMGVFLLGVYFGRRGERVAHTLKQGTVSITVMSCPPNG